ncbi:uncharacterized protein BXZ73DRAFT_40479 [Epithele typhae]|uniref:uncharacterized protein n=1 Tax=Epithele typhae TaxID=378194 RepID=UPI002008348B|nr:uncharacterized protein BXZ73DRAFT_40479 [Epithele typhae]KAH9943317.1 hypothetical protein BXZ73DRAFT_40479 [Epithele typhae]
MANDDDWEKLLDEHPVLALPKSVCGLAGKGEASLHLSLSSLPDFVDLDPLDDKPTPSGRRQAIAIRDADLIVAAGSELRIAQLGDSKTARSSSNRAYKVLHTPNIQFDIHQIVLNPTGKLLAVASAFQVAVVVLPRSGFSKLVTSTVDCKSFQVGQYNHAVEGSTPIAKIDWHPWGQGGSTLLVMTTDGKLREYDVSVDAEEPQQVLSFMPEKTFRSYSADDSAVREITSFTLGKGRADWGPLTVYALTRSSDIYAICPYLPKNATIPSTYVHALECYVAAKQEYLSRRTSHSSEEAKAAESLSVLYDHQHKFVNALLKQLPPGTTWPATTRMVPLHPPNIIKAPRTRQGPFLLQPQPLLVRKRDVDDGTDIVYVSFADEVAGDSDGDGERLGGILVAHQSGTVDVFFDVEKVEARWNYKEGRSDGLPMLVTYETIDLGIIAGLQKASDLPQVPNESEESKLLDLLQGNSPVFLCDPIHSDTVYVYHAFGVHVLNLGPLLRGIISLIHDSEEDSSQVIGDKLATVQSTEVQPILLTFSVEQQCSSPIIGVAVPNDIYLTYSIFLLTSSMRMSVFPLTLRSDTSYSIESKPAAPEKLQRQLALPPSTSTTSDSSIALSKVPPISSILQLSPDDPPAYVSLLGKTPWAVPAPIAAQANGLPKTPRVSLPQNLSASRRDAMLTPDGLRFFGSAVERLSAQIDDVKIAQRGAEMRAELQKKEFARQRETCAKMLESMRKLRVERQEAVSARLERLKTEQASLLARLERVLGSLTKKATPELSESEAKWFEELRRMKEEVAGAGKYDDRSLTARAKMLKREVDRLLPHLQEMKDKETARRKSVVESRESIGLSQAFELGKRSMDERSRIDYIESQVMRMAHKLDVSLGRPPSQARQDVKVEEDS